MMKRFLTVAAVGLIAAVPVHAEKHASDAVHHVGLAAEKAHLKDHLVNGTYSEDMIEPILHAAMKRAVTEYHGWDDYQVSQK